MIDDISWLRQLPLKSVSSFFQDKRIPLHAMIANGGHARETSPSYCFRGLDRGEARFAVLQFTLDGLGRFETPAGGWDLDQGSLMIANVPGDHSYFLAPGADHWEFVYLVVHGREILRITAAIEKRMGSVLKLPPRSSVPSRLVDIVTALFSAETMTAFDNSRMAYAIGMDILSHSSPAPRVGETDRFAELKAFLQTNLKRDISVSEMAEFAGLSRSYFTRLFEEIEGSTPRSFLEDLRLREAVRLLHGPDFSVKEIAYASGIYDVNYFCRLFKKRTGMSPGEFRKAGF
jgi:AraC-like DNA-binding protein